MVMTNWLQMDYSPERSWPGVENARLVEDYPQYGKGPFHAVSGHPQGAERGFSLTPIAV